jgi:outer membrane protein insertion porin family
LRAPASEPRNISAVDINGATLVLPLETRAGDPLDPAKVRSDVKMLWRSGRFSDVRVESMEEPGGVRVVFRLTPKHTVRLRKVEVKPPTPGIDLKATPDADIDLLDLHQIGASVRKQLRESGFPDAKVETSLVSLGAAQADLRVNIDQGKRIDIGKVAFTGDLGEPGRDLHKALKSTSSKTMLPAIPGIWKGWHLLPGYSEDAVQHDAASLRSFYYARGYFDAEVKPVQPDLNSSKAEIHFDIRSGPRFAIRRVDLVDGARQIPIAPGPDGAFPARDVCKALFAERRDAEKAGILDFTPALEVQDVPGIGPDSRKWVDVTARVERGTSYHIGRIEFLGNRSFSDQTLRRTLLVNEGDLLDQMLLRKSMARINSTGFFESLTESSVVINTPPGSTRADITFQLREKKMRRWSFSGPVGPMSLGGSLQFSIGSRLPPWGRDVLELSTYTASLSLILLPKPLGMILPGLPNRRFFPLWTLQRPSLAGQPFLSGFTIAPQLGWEGILAGYGISKARNLFGGIFEGSRSYTPGLSVGITHLSAGRPGDLHEGTLYCEPPKTKLDWLRQIGGISTNVLFAFSPF